MYLKEIVTSGFKSFADKINIKLEKDITCIVGPNGSGKSNVVDAVRWVLGEQSVKSLRGSSSMQDVIFSGSKSRNPLNVAYVELIFDNSDNYLKIPYSEISIKRRIYRSGENEYFLNNEKVRLKDISNLFIDSGMGKESFNIISQGEVEKIVSSSSQDRRQVIEEAAGVLKYKKRKEEALRKLDKTHQNIERINDIIGELENRIEPLRKQSEEAKAYLEYKNNFENYEVALMVYDIDNIKNLLELSNNKKSKLERDLIDLNSNNNSIEVKILKDTNKLDELENKLSDYQSKILELTKETEKLNGEINLLKEQTKSSKNSENESKILSTHNKVSSLKKDISILKDNIKNLDKKVKELDNSKDKELISIDNLKKEKTNLQQDYSNHSKKIIELKNKEQYLEQEIHRGGMIPSSVRKVLEEPSLTGIDKTISQVVSTEEEYMNALNIALTSNQHFIITKDESSASNAIKYLKENNLGRATFFPLSVIKERYIPDNYLNAIKDNPNFVGVLSSLLTYNKKYDSIVKNQFGHIIVSKDLDGAKELSNLVDRKYRVITLEGDIINVGGSLTGGSLKQNKTVVTLKQDLVILNREEQVLTNELHEIEKSIESINKDITKKENNLLNIYKEKVSYEEEINLKNKSYQELEKELDEENKVLNNLESINSGKEVKLEKELITKYNKSQEEKEKLELKIESITEEISKLKDVIEKTTSDSKLTNSKIKELEKNKSNIELDNNKMEIKLENLLESISNDYEMTYERAKVNYKLDIDPDEARKKINKIKSKIKEIGMVNIGAIAEYEEVSTRYNHLTTQKDDLYNAEDSLLNIMRELDEVMKVEFKKAYDKINKEFSKVFVDLFGGGKASLELTDENNLLETGVNIVASPPGKKLTTIHLLSGGEKTLTAISLLFAILNVKEVPFCIFDEVEAALDEANVEQFGNYLNNYTGKTEFLIITHKKKTMEYAKTLYGITMQESGVSKLVSVNLEEKK